MSSIPPPPMRARWPVAPCLSLVPPLRVVVIITMLQRSRACRPVYPMGVYIGAVRPCGGSKRSRPARAHILAQNNRALPTSARPQIWIEYLAWRFGPRRRRERVFWMDFPRNEQAGAGALGLLGSSSSKSPTHRLATTVTEVTPGTLVTTTKPGGHGRVPSL